MNERRVKRARARARSSTTVMLGCGERVVSKVDEIGFTDLLPGSGHGPGGWSDVGRIEVYGKPVKR